MGAFDLEGARKEGYTDDEIADYLATQKKFDVAGARAEGYSSSEILAHLNPPPKGILDRAWEAVSGRTRTAEDNPPSLMGAEIGPTATDVGERVDIRGSVFNGLPIESVPVRPDIEKLGAPISNATAVGMRSAMNTMTPAQRQAAENAPGWMGSVAGKVNEARANPDTASRQLDTNVPGMSTGSLLPGASYDTEADAKYADAGTATRGLRLGSLGTAKAVSGIGRFASDALGLDSASNFFAQQVADFDRTTKGIQAQDSTKRNYLSQQLEGAIASSVQNVPTLAAGIFAGSGKVALLGMGAMSFGNEYAEGADQGLSPAEASARASIMAAFEVIGERVGMPSLLNVAKQVTRGMPAKDMVKAVLNHGIKETGGELVTSNGQFLTDKLAPFGLNPGASLEDYVKNMADTVTQTVMQTAMMGGAGAGANAAVRKFNELPSVRADNAKENALARWAQDGLTKGLTKPDAAPGATPTTPPAAPNDPLAKVAPILAAPTMDGSIAEAFKSAGIRDLQDQAIALDGGDNASELVSGNTPATQGTPAIQAAGNSVPQTPDAVQNAAENLPAVDAAARTDVANAAPDVAQKAGNDDISAGRGAAGDISGLTTSQAIGQLTQPISYDDARAMVAGKTEKPGGVDPLRQIDAGERNKKQYRIGNMPLSAFRENESGDRYDGTVDADRAAAYAARPAAGMPPIIAVLSKDGTKLNVLDGGHRISAARMRGDATISTLLSLNSGVSSADGQKTRGVDNAAEATGSRQAIEGTGTTLPTARTGASSEDAGAKNASGPASGNRDIRQGENLATPTGQVNGQPTRQPAGDSGVIRPDEPSARSSDNAGNTGVRGPAEARGMGADSQGLERAASNVGTKGQVSGRLNPEVGGGPDAAKARAGSRDGLDRQGQDKAVADADRQPDRRATARNFDPDVADALNKARELGRALRPDSPQSDVDAAYRAAMAAEDLRESREQERKAPKFVDYAEKKGKAKGEIKFFSNASAALKYKGNKKIRGYAPRETADGWVLSKPFKPRSEKQLANDAKKKAKTEPIDILRDELQVALRKMGGIDIDEALASGFDKADIARANIPGFGNRKLFRKGGMSLDAAREAIAQGSEQAGYLDPNQADDPNHFIDRLMDSVKDQASYYSFAGQEYQLAMSEAAKEADRGRSGVQLDREDQAEAGIDSLPKQAQNEVQAAWASIDRSMLERTYPSDVIEELSAAEAQRRKEQEDEITAFAEREAISENGEGSPADRTRSAQDDRGDEPRSAGRGDEGDSNEAGQGTRSEVTGSDAGNDNAWLTDLFTQTANSIEEAPAPKTPDIANVLSAIDAEIENIRGDRANWQNKVYKGNAKQVFLQGDGPSRNESMSVGAINENRRRKVIESLGQQIADLQGFANALKESPSAAMGRVEKALTWAKSEDAKQSNARMTADERQAFAVASMVLNSNTYGPAARAIIAAYNQWTSKGNANSLNTSPERVKETPQLKVDNPGGEWLQQKQEDNTAAGRGEYGEPRRFGPVTGTYSAPVRIPVDVLAKIPGLRGEQRNVRAKDLAAIKSVMEQSGKLPLNNGKEYAPFVMVSQDGEAWVSEGNHRIMAARDLGWDTLPVEVRYFSGGENAEGPLSPKRIEGYATSSPQDRVKETAESDYISEGDYNRALGATYKDSDSRTTPQTAAIPPVGTWMRSEYKTNDGRLVHELVELPVDNIEISEDTGPQKWADVKRYAEWLKEGKEAPPIRVTQTDKGTLKASDHRRLLAAKAVGNPTIKAWVSWTTTARGTEVGLTQELREAGAKPLPTKPARADYTIHRIDAPALDRIKAELAAPIASQPESNTEANPLIAAADRMTAAAERMASAAESFLQNQTPADLAAKQAQDESKAAEEKRIADLERDQPLQLQGQDTSADRIEAEKKRAQKPLFSRGGIWKSQMSDAIGTLMANQEPAKALSLKVEAWAKAGKFKQDELTWSGLSDWLKTQDGKVTKQQVQDFIRENGVRVEEVTLGGEVQRLRTDDVSERNIDSDDEDSGVVAQYSIDVPSALKEQVEYLDLTEYSDGMAELNDSGNVRWSGNVNDMFDALSKVEDYLAKSYGVKFGSASNDPTKFSQYQLPGGENYRELLLTLPRRMPAGLSVDQNKYGEWVVRDPSNGNTHILAATTKEAAVREAAAVIPNRIGLPTPQPEFRSSHFDQPNILSHVRFNERTDATGARVLFIEEIQSDWAQKGRKEGFANEGARSKPEVMRDLDGVVNALRERTGNYVPTEQDWAANPDLKNKHELLESEYKKARDYVSLSAVPAAPFVHNTTAWTSLAMKRMVKYAIDNGFDRVAWTTGEQQAARYDLSKQIGAINYEPIPNTDLFEIEATDLNGKQVLSEDEVTLSRIEDLVGKEIAQKIKAREGKVVSEGGYRDWHRLSGLDLKVGGEGMRGYYDKIIPSVANDLLKKLGGGKVEEIVGLVSRGVQNQRYEGREWSVAQLRVFSRTMDAPAMLDNQMADVISAMRSDGLTFVDAIQQFGSAALAEKLGGKMHTEERFSSQPGFTITDKMRESAQGGLPLFARNQKQAQAAPTKAEVINWLSGPISSSFAKVNVYENGRDAKKANPTLPNNAAAWYAPETGELHFVANRIANAAHAQFLFFHEVFHAGVGRAEFRGVYQAMYKAQLQNKNVRDAARTWKESYGAETVSGFLKVGLTAGEAAKRVNAMAIEEAIADLSGQNVEIKGINGVISAIQKVLRALGLTQLANWMEGKTNAEVLQLIKAVRESVMDKNMTLTTDATEKYHRAFHGSPHDHDGFSLDKIGTGEGAQAYGYGLYFASNREVADHYKRVLSSRGMNSLNDKFDRMKVGDRSVTSFDVEMREEFPAIVATRDKEAINRAIDGYIAGWNKLQDDATYPFRDYAKDHAAAWKNLKTAVAKDGITSGMGAVYEVELAPKQEDYLDWDKPLSEQSEKVRGIIGEVERKRLEPMLAEKEARRAEMENSGKDTAAIDRQIAVLKEEVANNKLGDSLGGTGDRYYRSLSMKMGGDQAASAYLKSIGIPGIRYLDGSSRSKGEGNSNFVIFDDKDVSIVAKYSRTDQTESPAFKRWFSGSKVVDAEGKPLIVYHGTRRAFNSFEAAYPRGAIGNEKGIYFTADRRTAEEYAMDVDGAWDEKSRVIPVYLSINSDKDGKIKDSSYSGREFVVFDPTKIKSAAENSGDFDGTNPDIRYSRTAADAPNETKGAANAYTTKKLASMAIGGKMLGEIVKNPSKFNWINKTLNTQLHKGLKNKEFGKVVWATQQFMEDVSQFATQAADFVPDILPNLGNTTHAVKWLNELKNPAKLFQKKKDLKDAGRMIFEGTMAGGGNPMEGRLYSEADLKAKGLSDRAIEFYMQARKAIDKSINDLVMSDVIRMIGTRIDLDPSRYDLFKVDSVGTRPTLIDAIDQSRRDAVKVASAAKKAYEKAKQDREYAQDLNANFVKRQERYTKEGGIGRVENASKAEIENLTKLEAKAESLMKKEAKRLDAWTDIQNKVEAAFKQADDLQKAGYAPLMRFGKLWVRAVKGGETLHRAHYENRLDLNAAKAEMRKAFPDATIETGIQSDLDWQRFKGMTPETIMLFAETLGLNMDEHQAAQQWYQEAVSSRSTLKRHIKRDGIPGFSDDLSRVLAGFITSNSRRASVNYNMPLIQQAQEAINKNDGDIRDEASKLIDQINNPTEDAAALRGIMYAWFIGGSVASAAVNFTQPLTMTLPELSQWGTVKAALAMKHAMRVKLPAHLQAAKKLADEKGITNPQEVYYLYNEAIRGVSSNKNFQTAMWAWGAMFSFAENMNRRTTFLASYEMWETADAKTRENMTEVTGATNAFDFAKRIIQRTQGIYNKGNRLNWARGPIGATIFTFKQYGISYLEFVSRLPTKQKAMAAAILILMAGLQGLPGAEDLEDIIDTLGQMMGYRTNSKDFLRQKAIELLGETAGAFLMTGLFNQSGRLGLGNLIPGTAMFKRSETDRGDDLGEAVGPIGSLGKNVLQAFDEAQAGDYEGAITSILPKAMGDFRKGKQIWDTGAAKDFKNRDVVQDLDKGDALLQGIGFNPGKKTDATRESSAKRQDANQVKDVQSDIVQLWAEGIAQEDDAKMERASNMLESWNEKNPEASINRGDVIDSALRRRNEMGKSREERQQKTLPKSLRGYYSDR